MSQTITIVGASARAAASSAARAGFSVHAADLFADLDLQRICQRAMATAYPEGLPQIVGESQAGGWMYTGALENYPALVDAMAAIRPLWGNEGKILRQVRDPLQLAEVLRGAGLPCTAVARTGDSLSRDVCWLKKPFHSAGGANVSKWNPKLDPQVASAKDYFQQFIEGPSYSAVYVANKENAALLGVTRQLIGSAWTGADGFRYCGSIGPLALLESQMSQFAAIGSAVARAFGLVGLFGVDAIVSSEGVWCVEVNPRYTASTELLDLAFGYQAVALHVLACESGELPNASRQAIDRCFGKAILFASHDFVVSPELSAKFEGQTHSKPRRLADIPASGSIIQAGWPVVTLLEEAADEQAVLESLQQSAGEIQSWWTG